MRPAALPVGRTAYTSDMSSSPAIARRSSVRATPWQRHPAAIAVWVVAIHVGAIWALQSGLLRRAMEVVVPAEILVELWNPPAPTVAPMPPTKAPAMAAPRKTATTPPPAPTPLAIPEPTPVPSNTAVQSAQNAINSVATTAISTRAEGQKDAITPLATTPAPSPAAPPKVELPSSDADYLNNPKPPYPTLSKRMGEQGKVVVRALIGTDGRAQDTQLVHSSGFERLDQAALKAAREWRYVPGKRDGVPQAMWFNIPFTFQLQ